MVAGLDGGGRWSVRPRDERIMDARFSVDGRLVATGLSDGTSQLFDLGDAA